MKTLIALLALALLVVPMLAGIRRLRSVPRRPAAPDPSRGRVPPAHSAQTAERSSAEARSSTVPIPARATREPEMANQGNDDRNRQQGGGSDNQRQQQQQQSDSDRNRQQGGDRDRGNNRQQG